MGTQKEEEVICVQTAWGLSQVAKSITNKQAMHPTPCSPATLAI
jgi:hypothetical protein